MAGKQIIDLEAAESFGEGDLLMVRKSGMGVDRKISYADFTRSIGSSAVNGYVSELDEGQDNKIILKPANNAAIYKYYEDMKVSFTAPAKTNGIVQLRIGELEYKNLYKYKSNVTVSLEKDDYIEAILIDDCFRQVNDFKTIIEKEVIEIDSAGIFGKDDMLLLKKSSSKENKKIAYDDFMESIGNSAINGYVAKLDKEQENKIILKPSNNAPIDKYYQGMKITFVAPKKTTGSVKVRVGDLDYKNLYKHKSDISVSLEEADYIEAVLIGEHFQQINDLKSVTSIYTNDYICIAHESPKSGVSTDLTLSTAYGLQKHEYYNGMSITFMCPVNTKGAVRVNIDGLGAKDIIEGEIEEFLHMPLYKGQIVQAMFNGVCFVKNKFQVEDPKIRPSLEPSLTTSPNEIPKSIIPKENMLEFNIGGSNSHFSNLRKALEEILSKYADTSGKYVTFNILQDLDFERDSIFIHNRDLSWITIKGNNQNRIKIFYNNAHNSYLKEVNIKRNCGSHYHMGGYYGFLTLHACRNGFNFAENTIITYDFMGENPNLGALFKFDYSNINLKNITVDVINLHPSIIKHPSSSITPLHLYGGSINMEKVIFKGAGVSLYITMKSTASLTNCKFSNYLRYGIEIRDAGSDVTIKNCDLSQNGTSSETDIWMAQFTTVTQINSKAKSNKEINTLSHDYRYSVVGSQDEVGK